MSTWDNIGRPCNSPHYHPHLNIYKPGYCECKADHLNFEFVLRCNMWVTAVTTAMGVATAMATEGAQGAERAVEEEEEVVFRDNKISN